MEKVRKLCVGSTLNTMKVGDTVVFTFAETMPATVRSNATMLKKTQGKIFQVNQDRTKYTTTVTRLQ